VRRRYCASCPSRGFVLLYVLWLLLGAVMVFAALSWAVLDQYRAAAAEGERLQLDASAESALHDRIFEMLVIVRERPQNGDVRELDLAARPAVSSGRSDGLIDLNTAEDRLIERAFQRSMGDRAKVALESLRLWRPISSYADLVAATSVTEAELGCLLQTATLFSGRREPDALAAPPEVAAWLGNRPIGTAGVVDVVATEDRLARPWWILVEVTGRSGLARRLRADFILINRPDRPYGLLDRRWLDVNRSLVQCP
jgi:hypothetical protein